MKVNKLKLFMLCLCFLLFMSFQHCASAGNQKIGSGYRLVSLEENSNGGGLLGKLELKQKTSVYGPDVPHLCLFVK